MTPELRAWDEVQKRMIGFAELCFHYNLKNVLYRPNLTRLICEQYIGLKDKNGNKIFEGDIVRNEQGKTSVVNFKKGSFLVGDFYFGSIGAGMQLELVGNIHENTELLEAEK
jgi:uncharacterized phage protein (TIGR01671 family)